MPTSPSSALLRTFLSRRAALQRYFAGRVGQEEAEDVVQEIYLHLTSIPADAQIGNPPAYLYRLGSNIVLDRLRQSRSRSVRETAWRGSQVSVVAGGKAVSETVPADRDLVARDQVRRMEQALCELPEPVQRSFRLQKVDGMPQGEVAAAMGVSKSLVEKHMARALKHIVARLRP